MADNNALLAAALEYAELGWHVVPIKPRGKVPIAGAQWQKKATTNEEQIEAWWRDNPDANVGVKLGEQSGIIDFEGDGPDAEETLNAMFAGDPVVTPTYQSSRGKHRLFRFRNDLPEPEKNNFKVGGLEVRTGYGGKAAQSVMPPSIHSSGAKYTWLVHPSECEPAPIPDRVQAWLWNWCNEPIGALPSKQSKVDWKAAINGVGEGERNETSASFIGRIVASIRNVFDEKDVAAQWMCVQIWNRENRPPLEVKELRATFESILRRERRKRTTDNACEEFESDAPSVAPQDWKIEIVTAKPRIYRLYAPLWAHKTDGGYIEVTSAELLSPREVRRVALEQADVWIDGKKFDPRWSGSKGLDSLARQLIDAAEHIEASPEERRDVIVCELILDRLNRAHLAKEDQPDEKGRPVRMSDGSVWFKVNRLREDPTAQLERITVREVSRELKLVGATDEAVRVGENVIRFKRLCRKSLQQLELKARCNLVAPIAPYKGEKSVQKSEK